jgi:hypothetical protein
LVTTFPATGRQAQVVVLAGLQSGELDVGASATALDNTADTIDCGIAGSTDSELILNAGENHVAHAEALEENLEGLDTAISGDASPTDVSQVAARSGEVAGGLEAEVEIIEDDIVPDDNSAESLLDDSAVAEAGEHEVLNEVDWVAEEAQGVDTPLSVLSDNGVNQLLQMRITILEGSEVLAALIDHGSAVQADGTIQSAGVVGEELSVLTTQATELVSGAIVVIIIVIITIAMASTATATEDCCLVGMSLSEVGGGIGMSGNFVNMGRPLFIGKLSLARSENNLFDQRVEDGVDDRECGNS